MRESKLIGSFSELLNTTTNYRITGNLDNKSYAIVIKYRIVLARCGVGGESKKVLPHYFI